MKRLDSYAAKYVKNNKRKQGIRQVLAIMSVFVVLLVALLLMMPAYSLTKEEYANGDTPPSSSELGDLSSYELQDNQISNIDFDVISNDGEVQNVEFNIAYSLDIGNVSLDTPYVIYSLDDPNITITGDLPANNLWGVVKDGVRQSGVYHVYANPDGSAYLLIEFFDDYLSDFSGSPISGTVSFTAEVERAEGNNTSMEEVTIGGQTIVIDNFNAREMGVSKSGELNEDGEVIWTVVISNPDQVDMSGDPISDQYLNVDTDITVTPTGAVTYDGSGYVISDGVSDKTVTIQYITPLSDEFLYSTNGSNVSNTVHFEHDGTDYEKSANVWVANRYWEGKTGSVDEDTGEFVWTISIYNPYGRTLKDFILEDEMFANAVAGSIVISSDSVSDAAYTQSGNSIVFDEDIYDEQITVTYRTPITDLAEDEDVSNTAILKNPDNEERSRAGTWIYYQAPETPSVSKSHSVNDSLTVINYSIVMRAGAGNLEEGFYVSDKYLEELTDGSLKLQAGWYGDLTEGVDYEFIDTDSNGKADTVRLLREIVDGGGNNVSFATIYYSIEVDNEDLPNRTEEGDSITFVNTATIGDTTGDRDSDTDTTVIEPQYSLGKNVDSGNVSKVDNGDGTETYTIPWNVNLFTVNGTYLGKTYTDNTYYDNEISSGETSDNKHYYNGDAVVKVGNTIVDPTYYTVTEDANGGFAIYFKDESEAPGTHIAGAEQISISYTTTAVSSDSKGVYVKNTGTTPEGYDEDEYFLEYNNFDDTPYEKSGPSKLKLNEAETVEVDGTEYIKIPYTFTYDPSVRAGMSDSTIFIQDTLPEGGRLWAIRRDWEQNIYAMYYKESEAAWFSEDNSNYNIWTDNPSHPVHLDYTDGSDTAIFRINPSAGSSGEVLHFVYYVLLPKEDVEAAIDSEGVLNISNTLADTEGNYDESTVDTTIKDGNTTDESNINKSGGQGITDGYADYSIDINPEGANLSTDGVLEINDNVYLQSMTDDEIRALYGTSDISNVDKNVNFDNVKFTLESIHVYEVGDDSSLTELSSDSYTVDASTHKSSATEVTDSKELTKGNDEYTGNLTYNAGDTIEYTIYGTPGSTFNPWLWFSLKDQFAGDNTTVTFDDDGTYTYSVVAQNSGTEVKIGGGSFNSFVTGVTATVIGDVSTYSNITLSLPDGKHLRVMYTYKIEYTSDSKRVALKVKNIASLTGSEGREDSENTSSISVKDSTSATSFTAVPVKLNKVNLNNININVTAGFNLYKYDETDHEWKVATAIDETQVQIGANVLDTHTVSSWESANATNIENAEKIVTDNYTITLDKAVLYMIVEVEAPNPYILLNEPKFIVYTEAPGVSVISEAEAALANVNSTYTFDGYDTITNGIDATANYTIKNRNYINVSATKNWTVSQSTNLDDYKIEVGLYRTDRTGRVNNLPTDRNELEALLNTWTLVDSREISSADNWTFNWYGDPEDPNYTGIPLESGTDDDEVWYYYVAETAVYHTDNGGSTWEDVTDEFDQTSTAKWSIVGTEGYTGDHTLGNVNIYNTGGISVRKIWQDSSRTELTQSQIQAIGATEVQLTLYRSTIAPSDPDEDYDENGIPEGAEVVSASELNGIEGITLNGNKIVLNQSNEWSQVLDDLPTNDGVNSYYYYVKEETTIADISGVSSLQTIYHSNGSTGGEIFVYNIVEIPEESGVVLPKTGGVGTTLIYVAGLLMILISFIALSIKKRTDKLEINIEKKEE